MFISCINQKGGTGKTTLALHIAAYLAGQGAKTLLIDADPQASTMAWAACRSQGEHANVANLTITAISNGTITRQLAELSRTYQCVVIDGPPRGDAIERIHFRFVWMSLHRSPFANKEEALTPSASASLAILSSEMLRSHRSTEPTNVRCRPAASANCSWLIARSCRRRRRFCAKIRRRFESAFPMFR
jgi:anion-transporting  ArsA/GET3 family ATPase